MEVLNDSSKLIARSLELLKHVLHRSNEGIFEMGDVNEAKKLLEEALIKLTEKM